MDHGPELEERLAQAGLRLASADELPLRRVRRGRGFSYTDAAGHRVDDAATLERVRSLVIPPAYRDVRIAASPRDHIQAVGRDEAGRLQYLYHERWELVRLGHKSDRLAVLCEALPRIRRRVGQALAGRALDRERVIAAVVMLIDRTHIRIGSEAYVHTGRSRGATTLLKRHVRISGGCVHLTFRGKRRQPISCDVEAREFLAVVRQLRRLPGRRLFQYRAEGGIRRVSAVDVNGWLAEVVGRHVTAKDFRTLAASAAAVELFATMEAAEAPSRRKRQVAGVMRQVAGMLVNTPAVARSSYVHPAVVEAFHEGRLPECLAASGSAPWLSRKEAAVATLVAGHRPGNGA